MIVVLTPSELDAIEARANAATAGPWCVAERTGTALMFAQISAPDGQVGSVTNASSAFVAHARTDVPALIAEVRRLQEAVRELRHALDDAKGSQP